MVPSMSPTVLGRQGSPTPDPPSPWASGRTENWKALGPQEAAAVPCAAERRGVHAVIQEGCLVAAAMGLL